MKTSAQQEAEKKERRKEEIKIFQTAMNTIFEKRRENSHENESLLLSLKMTGSVLMNNPDITTMWNMRKEALSELIKDQELDKDKLMKKEVELTVSCLSKNPKSYGAWHHRCWSLLKMNEPNWEYELLLCNKYLSMDERNFHCWDYRRFVVKNAKISTQAELEFSMEKIHDNFSNYSAWHYRSKLLPVTDPGLDGKKITEQKRRQELDLVLNAAFTDPDDSSAWFYHKWLLGLANDSPKPVLALSSGETFQVAFSSSGNYLFYLIPD